MSYGAKMGSRWYTGTKQSHISLMNMMNKVELVTLDEMIKDIERMPEHALMMGINHYDFLRLLYLLKAALSEKSGKGSPQEAEAAPH